jgi:predicted outer membrane repeat protein
LDRAVSLWCEGKKLQKHNEGYVKLDSFSLDGNEAYYGGGIFSTGDLTLTGPTSRLYKDL